MSEEGEAEKRGIRNGKPPGLSQWYPICLSASPSGNIGVQYSGYSGTSDTELQPEPCSSGLTYPWEALLHLRPSIHGSIKED